MSAQSEPTVIVQMVTIPKRDWDQAMSLIQDLHDRTPLTDEVSDDFLMTHYAVSKSWIVKKRNEGCWDYYQPEDSGKIFNSLSSFRKYLSKYKKQAF